MLRAYWVVCKPQVGKYGPGQPADFTGARVTRSVDESLERLDTTYIDLVLIHDIEYVNDLKAEVSFFFPHPETAALPFIWMLPLKLILHMAALMLEWTLQSTSSAEQGCIVWET